MNTMILMIVVFGMITVTGFSILPAYGLSCGIPFFTESYERHDLLLHGKLVEKEHFEQKWYWENK